MVMSVDPQGPGAAAGVYQGDIIVTWNSEPNPACALASAGAGAGQCRPDGHARIASSRRDKTGPADHRREERRLSAKTDPDPIRLALNLADAALADRLAALLASVPGLRLVGEDETADAVVVLSTDPSLTADGDIPLTPRELEVLALLAEGASNKMIAKRLGISVHTAKFHVGSLLDKLDAVGRTDAVAHAARLGVINL